MEIVRQVIDVAKDLEHISLVQGAEGFAVALGGTSDKLRIIGLLEARPTHIPPLG